MVVISDSCEEEELRYLPRRRWYSERGLVFCFFICFILFVYIFVYILVLPTALMSLIIADIFLDD